MSDHTTPQKNSDDSRKKWITYHLENSYELNSWSIIEGTEFQDLILELCVIDFENIVEVVFSKIYESVKKQEAASDSHKSVQIKLYLMELMFMKYPEKINKLDKKFVSDKMIKVLFSIACNEADRVVNIKAVERAVSILQILSDEYSQNIVKLLQERVSSVFDDVEEDPIQSIPFNVINLHNGKLFLYLEALLKVVEKVKVIRSSVCWKINKLLIEWAEENPNELISMFNSENPSRDTIILSWIQFIESVSDSKDGRHYSWPLLSCLLFLSNNVLNILMTKANSKTITFITTTSKKLNDQKSALTLNSPIYVAWIISQMSYCLQPLQNSLIKELTRLCFEKILNFINCNIKNTKLLESDEVKRFMENVIVTTIRQGHIKDIKIDEMINSTVVVQNILIRSVSYVLKKSISSKSSHKEDLVMYTTMYEYVFGILKDELFIQNSVKANDRRSLDSIHTSASIRKAKKLNKVIDRVELNLQSLKFLRSFPEMTISHSLKIRNKMDFVSLCELLCKVIVSFENSNLVTLAARIILDFHELRLMNIWIKPLNLNLSIKLINETSFSVIMKGYGDIFISSYICWIKTIFRLRYEYFQKYQVKPDVIEPKDRENLENMMFLLLLKGKRKLSQSVLHLFGVLANEIKLSTLSGLPTPPVVKNYSNLAAIEKMDVNDAEFYDLICDNIIDLKFQSSAITKTFQTIFSCLKGILFQLKAIHDFNGFTSACTIVWNGTKLPSMSDSEILICYSRTLNFLLALGCPTGYNNTEIDEIFDNTIDVLFTVLFECDNSSLFQITLDSMSKYMPDTFVVRLLTKLYPRITETTETQKKSSLVPSNSLTKGKSGPVDSSKEKINSDDSSVAPILVFSVVIKSIFSRIENVSFIYDQKLDATFKNVIKYMRNQQENGKLTRCFMETLDSLFCRIKELPVSDLLLLKYEALLFVKKMYTISVNRNFGSGRRLSIENIEDKKMSKISSSQSKTSIVPCEHPFEIDNQVAFRIVKRATVDFSIQKLQLLTGSEFRHDQFSDFVYFMINAITTDGNIMITSDPVNKHAISALGNFLMANIEIGLSHIITFCNSNKLQVRVTVLEILISSLTSATNSEMEVDEYWNSEMINNIENLFFNSKNVPKCITLTAFMNYCYLNLTPHSKNRVFSLALRLLAERNILKQYLEYCFTEQAKNDTDEHKFRRESQYIYLMTTCLQWFGNSFTRLLISPVISTLKNIKNHSIEKTIEMGLSVFFRSLKNCLNGIPPKLCWLFSLLNKIIGESSQQNSRFVTLGIFNIRLLLSSFNSTDIPPQIGSSLATIVQEVQNMTTILLEKSNDRSSATTKFDISYLDILDEFSKKLILCKNNTNTIVNKDPMTIYLFFNEALPTLPKFLKNLSENRTEMTTTEKKHIETSLGAILSNISSTAENMSVISKTSLSFKNSPEAYSHNESASLSFSANETLYMKGIFFKFQKDLSQRDVYYLIPSVLNTMSINKRLIHSVVKYIRHIANGMSAGDWVLVIDLAGFNPYFQILMDTVLDRIGTWSKDVLKYLKVIYLINSNSESHAYARYKQRSKIAILNKIHIKYVEYVNSFNQFIKMENMPSQQLYFVPIPGSKDAVIECRVCGKEVCSVWISNQTIVIKRNTICPISSEQLVLFDTFKFHEIKTINRKSPKEFSITMKNAAYITLESENIEVLLNKLTADDAILKKLNSIKVPDKGHFDEKLGLITICALFHMLHPSAVVKQTAFTLFDKFTDTFKLKETFHFSAFYINWVPDRDVEFVYELSNLLALNEPMCTFEVISVGIELFNNFDFKQQSHILPVIRPWVNNLKSLIEQVEDGDYTPFKIKLNMFVEVTKKNPELSEEININIWEPICSCEIMVQIATETVIMHAMLECIEHEDIDVLSTICLTISKKFKTIVARMLNEHIKREMFIVSPTSNVKNTDQLFKSVINWDSIKPLFGFLCNLTFYDRADVNESLPLMIFVILINIALFRDNCHRVCSALMNTLLFIQRNKDLNLKESTRSILLYQISYIDCQFDCYTNSTLTLDSDNSSWLYLRNISEGIVSIFRTCDEDNTNLKWTNTWNQLLKTCSQCQNHSNIQAFTLFLQSITSTSNFEEIISDLFNAATKTTNLSGQEFTIQCVFSSFQILLSKPDMSFDRVNEIFWLAIGCMVLSYESLYLVALAFMDKMLVILIQNRKSSDEPLSVTLLKYRSKRIDLILTRIEETVGISFKKSFNFAFAAIMAKVCQHKNPTFRPYAHRICYNLVEHYKTSSSCHQHVLPYIPVMLISNEKNCKIYFNDEPIYHQLAEQKDQVNIFSLLKNIQQKSSFILFGQEADIFSRIMTGYSLICFLSVAINEFTSQLQSTDISFSLDENSTSSSGNVSRFEEAPKTFQYADSDITSLTVKIRIILEALARCLTEFPEVLKILNDELNSEIFRLLNCCPHKHDILIRILLHLLNDKSESKISEKVLQDLPTSLNVMLSDYNFYGYKVIICPFIGDTQSSAAQNYFKKLCLALSSKQESE